jgi:DNA-binding GntR family transcriptional regulator
MPLYFQVAEQLERAITDGALLPGERIANEIALADSLGLSRPTLRQAIQTLVDKGLVVRKRGVGTLVVSSPIRRSVDLTSLYDDLLAEGRSPRTELLELRRSGARPEQAAELQLPAGTPVWQVRRLRLVGDEPLALLSNTIPADLVDLESVDLTAVGLYAFLRSCAVNIRVAHQSIGARRASAPEARSLALRGGGPVLTMRRTAFDDGGRAVEVGSHAYRPDLYSFKTTLVAR